jgi:hypothetical protein
MVVVRPGAPLVGSPAVFVWRDARGRERLATTTAADGDRAQEASRARGLR